MSKKNSVKKEKKPSKKVEESKLEKDLEKAEHPKKEEAKIIQKRQAEILEEITPQALMDVKAPVLERVASQAPAPIFVRTGQRTSGIADEKESDSFKYTLDAAKNNEPKYSNFEGNYLSNLMTTPERNIRTTDLAKREVNVGMVSDSRISNERQFERYDAPKRMEDNRDSRTDVIQGKKEIKYTPSH